MEAAADREHTEALLDYLEELVRTLGVERFLRAPLIYERPEFFPDPWESSLLGVARVLHRLLYYAGLDGWSFEIIDARNPLDDGARSSVSQPVIDLIEAKNGRIVFQLDQLGRAEWVPAVLCFEVARACVVAKQTHNPYRDGEHLADGDTAQDRELAAVASVFLGLGVIAANGADAFAQEGEIAGYSTITYRNRLMLGELPPEDLTYLLAVQLLLRGEEPSQVLQGLAANQAQEVRRWLAELADTEPALRQRLGFPEPAPSVVPLPLPEVPPLPAATQAALTAAEERYRKPFADKTVPRYFERKSIQAAFGGLLIAVLPVLLLILLAEVQEVTVIGAILCAGGVLGALVGRWWREFSCGACGIAISSSANVCWSCGAVLEGERPASEKLAQTVPPDDDEQADNDGEDAAEDELTRQALSQDRQDFGEHGQV